MSAFMCSRDHISTLANMADHKRRFFDVRGIAGPDGSLDAASTFNALAAENIASMEARYGAGTAGAVGTHTFRTAPRTPIELLKLIHCYEYQSCEHEGWEKSEAARYCRDLERSILCSLPGYEEAPWGLPMTTHHDRIARLNDAMHQAHERRQIAACVLATVALEVPAVAAGPAGREYRARTEELLRAQDELARALKEGSS